MKIAKIIIITLLSLVFLIGSILFLIGYLKPAPSGISVDSVPQSSVYINGKYVNKTPYKDVFETDKETIKLIPDGLTVDPYEVTVNLSAGAQTVIKHEFADSLENSQGYVLSFSKDPNKQTGMVVVTEPENAQVFIDGQVKGFSPYKATSLSATKHQLTIKAVDYLDKTITVSLYEGYLLNANIKLAKSPLPTPSPEPSPSTKTYIEILDTPTGFLRVRTQAGSKGEEIAEVKPKEKYLFIEEDAVSGWFKIQYSEPKAGLPNGIQGWVSNQYSKKVEE